MENKYTIDNLMPPLWLKYPEIRQFSIGWRMGYGESYKFELHEWYETLSEGERKLYQTMFPPPKTWRGYYDDSVYDADRDAPFLGRGSGIYSVTHWNENGKPRYSTEWLMNQNSSVEYVFFWRPGNIKNEPECCFGQWQYSNFGCEHKIYTCAEQYMMAEKARLFEDEEIEKEIMETTDPKQMKALGRKVKNFRDKLWDRLKYSVVLNGNYYKFAQNKKMRDILLSTDNKILVEASPLDTVWGIGYSENNSNAANPKLWRGLNLLGFALMEVRDDLKAVYQNYDKIAESSFECND